MWMTVSSLEQQLTTKMYLLALLCLVSAAAAMPAGEKIPELKPEIHEIAPPKDEHDVKVPPVHPLVAEPIRKDVKPIPEPAEKVIVEEHDKEKEPKEPKKPGLSKESEKKEPKKPEEVGKPKEPEKIEKPEVPKKEEPGYDREPEEPVFVHFDDANGRGILSNIFSWLYDKIPKPSFFGRRAGFDEEPPFVVEVDPDERY